VRALIRGLTVVALSLLARDAFATDVAGKWGLGAGFGNNDAEVSVIRGRSARSAWVFDAQASLQAVKENGSSSDPLFRPGGDSGSTISLEAGPGLRLFTNPSGDFSPYWDVFVHGDYFHRHDDRGGSIRLESYGADIGMAIGAEYFTKWHCSIAAHTDLFAARWEHVSQRQSIPLVVDISESGHTESFDFGVRPRLFLRAYF
jgi:hypothetical protein